MDVTEGRFVKRFSMHMRCSFARYSMIFTRFNKKFSETEIDYFLEIILDW